jgi:hypothetical protein
MADGRILSKRISRSDKVSALSTDTARMIYSWIIPYLDVEGRMEANPRLMKSDIAPLLDHITPQVIQEILNELNNIGLIVLYLSENKQYLQLLKFDENQPNLRKDREKKSQIPKAPAKIKQEKTELRQESGESPAEVPHKINIREVNIREAKSTPAELQPVDNSKPPASLKNKLEVNNKIENDIKKDEFMLKLKDRLDKTKDRYSNQFEQQAILLFVQANIRNKHPDAILHCIDSLVKAPDKVKLVQKYLETALRIEDGKYNARDSEMKNNDLKKLPENIASFMAAFSGMLKPMPGAN